MLEDLRDRVGASAHLGVLEAAEVLYLVRIPSHRALISNIAVGSRLPAHCTTMGRILLASLSEPVLHEMYPDRHAMPATWLSDLTIQLAEDRLRGFIATESAYEPGLVSVAAPVFDRDGRVIAAINVSAPTATLSLETAMRDAVPHVVATADAISRRMGLEP